MFSTILSFLIYTKHFFILRTLFQLNLIGHWATQSAFKKYQRTAEHLRISENTQAHGNSEDHWTTAEHSKGKYSGIWTLWLGKAFGQLGYLGAWVFKALEYFGTRGTLFGKLGL